MKSRNSSLEDMWMQHAQEWRDTAQIATHSREAAAVDPRLLEMRVNGDWWRLLEQLSLTLFVTREYEHLVLAMSSTKGKPRLTFLPVPHPSGLAIDRQAGRMFLASTRNPNQIYVLKPAKGSSSGRSSLPNPVLPVSSTFYPGRLYIHDLALIGGQLYANAVGHNAIVKLRAESCFEKVWWPKCIERGGEPQFDRNYIQLNSIAAGATVQNSYFSASSSSIGLRRPGHLNYKVDKQGVIFSGRTREPICFGLTRPHSARLANKKVWVANSGYGELGYVSDGKLEVIRRLPGWTRGLCITRDIAFVATSKVIPRYARYAPGLDSRHSSCGLHAVCITTGNILGSVEWPWGNQVFAIDWMDSRISAGFPFLVAKRNFKKENLFFYSFLMEA